MKAAGAPRIVPSRVLPIPDTVSPQLQEIIAQEPDPADYLVSPQSVQQWQALNARREQEVLRQLGGLRERFSVTATAKVIAGVTCYEVTPSRTLPRNRDRLLVNVHGGGYIVGSGEAGTLEAIYLAGFTGLKVLTIDYRMPPQHPFPAAVDDAMSVWREIARQVNPANLALCGFSAGGGLALVMAQCAKRDGLALPAVLIAATPWSDLSKTGDSYFTNAGVDNRVVAYEGRLEAAARLYAGDHDLRNPLLSPVYGDFSGFPPTLLVTGTRDLFLSNTVRVHRKLRQAGAKAVLEVYEGQSHCQFLMQPDAPEAEELFRGLAEFIDDHCGALK